MKALSRGFNSAHSFVPSPILRHTYLQTGLTTLKLDIPLQLRIEGIPFLIDAGADETGLDDEEVRLLAYYTPAVADVSLKGVAILLHGWEGSSHSNYCIITMRELTHSGYDVVRLNFRDHGPGLHVHPQALNPGVFLGTLLSESLVAISRCAELFTPLPVYLVGFSMGGNFALRLAAEHRRRPIPGLVQSIAVNPALDPLRSTLALDGHPILHRHFRDPWLQQLVEKEKSYPQLYNFSALHDFSSLMDMTDWLVDYLGTYRDAEEYFAAYSFLEDDTKELAVSSHVIATVDDPICPIDDIQSLAPSPHLTVDIHPYGGHVGFVDLTVPGPSNRFSPLAHRCGELVLQVVEDSQNG